MAASRIEELICSRAFPYLRPYFYNQPYALRCELGMGKTDDAWISNAYKQAAAICDILCPDGADAVLFNCWYDGNTAGAEEQEQFLAQYTARYRHVILENMPVYDPDDTQLRRNRVVCFSDGLGFNLQDLIQRQISGEDEHEISFVSFRNECIISVYDDRGCDIVFANLRKMRAFYPALQPYFLDCDRAEMQRRYEEGV